MAGSVLPSSERRRMRARVRVRALACPLRSRVLRSLRSSSFSRTPSCFGLLVVWFVRAKCHGERIPHKKQSGQVVDNRAGSERLIAWVGRSHTNRVGGVYNCPPPAGSPCFVRGTTHGFGSPCEQDAAAGAGCAAGARFRARVQFPLLAGGTLRRRSSIALVFVNFVHAIGITLPRPVASTVRRPARHLCRRAPKGSPESPRQAAASARGPSGRQTHGRTPARG